MPKRVLGVNPCVGGLGVHNPSATIFEDGAVAYSIEEERFTREKQAFNTFPTRSIERCLDYCGAALPDVDEVVIPWEPRLLRRLFGYNLRRAVRGGDAWRKAEKLRFAIKRGVLDQVGYSMAAVRDCLREIDEPLPPVTTVAHHRAHAASVTHLSELEEPLVLTVDGRGEHDSTVVWDCSGGSLRRVRTWRFPNSLGFLYGMVAEFLGYRSFNGEGKVMGLAPYGEFDDGIYERLLSVVDVGVDYDVTAITATAANDLDDGVRRLERLFDRGRKDEPVEFTDWERNLAFVTQSIVEETVTAIVESYAARLGTGDVGLAGGVALNCKMNKAVKELDRVENLFVQPVAHDSGSAIGAAAIRYDRDEVEPMETVYWGDGYGTGEIIDELESAKLPYREPEDLAGTVADRLADGALVGWFQGRLEMGPRALCNRSILADPRSTDHRDRVNRYVKHREEWRPFAPVVRLDAAADYLVNAREAPYMIQTFDVPEEKRDEIPAVLHAGDHTTRPQTVTESQNERVHALLTAFEERTGVPVLLNTSFNDHGEPIVRTPREAIRDFYATGLDLLVLEDVLVEKPV